MKGVLKNKNIQFTISILLIMLIAAVSFRQFQNPVTVKASGTVSIDLGQGLNYTQGQELVSERTENAKKYYLGKDSYALDVSIGAIHYKDNYANPQELWKDIDLNFKDGKITKAPYILTVNQDEKSFTVQDKKTSQTTTIKLTRVGNKDIKDIGKQAPVQSDGKIQWENVDTDLDLAITAENTRVSFDWIVKSANAPHEVQFEIKDGGIPITYQGTDADGKPVTVKTRKNWQ